MSRRSRTQFALVAAFWGASYLLIKVALDDVFSPPDVVFIRTALASIVLAPLAWRTGRLGELRPLVGPVFLLGLMQVAAPFMLISYGEQHIASSLAGILVAMAPVFTFLLSLVVGRDQDVHLLGGVGVALGIAGVVLLLGVDVGGERRRAGRRADGGGRGAGLRGGRLLPGPRAARHPADRGGGRHRTRRPGWRRRRCGEAVRVDADRRGQLADRRGRGAGTRPRRTSAAGAGVCGRIMPSP